MNNKDFQNGFALGVASGGVVEVIDTTEIDNLETLIDNSGVLEDTEGSVSEKVEQLIDRLDLFNHLDGYLAFGKNLKVESIDWYIDLPYVTQLYSFLRDNQYVKRMVGINTSNVFQMGMAFMNSAIEEIERPFDLSSITSANMLNATFKATYLREVRFIENCIKFSINFAYSPLLSAESIQSIIDGLATVETAQTLTLHKNIVLTDEQKATINAKGWTLAQ